MTLADMNSVDEVIRDRLASGRWVVSPTIASQALSWPVDRAARALDSLYRSDGDRLTLCLSSYCDHCGAQNSATAYSTKLISSEQALVTCATCFESFPVTLDNTRVEYHINSTHRGAGDVGKESAGVPTTDARR